MAFAYHNNTLHAVAGNASVSLLDVVRNISGPAYVYNLAHVCERYGQYTSAFKRPVAVRYALKANCHPTLIKCLAGVGAGADVVSVGELEAALEAGVPAAAVVFSGVGKSRAELERAMAVGVGQINVESLGELERIARLAKSGGKRVCIALRLNPDISAGTHEHITTGRKDNKFGLMADQIPEALEIIRRSQENIKLIGVAGHIGSQILTTQPLVDAVGRLKGQYLRLREMGMPMSTLDIGGGLGIDYEVESGADEARLIEYAQCVDRELADFDGQVIVEPGRFLVARAGALLTRVEYVKRSAQHAFVIVNSGMNHLLRPALYGAVHRIVPLVLDTKRPRIVADVVGPICESADVLGRSRELPEPREGDWLAILDAGAYGFSMASRYNLRPLPDEICLLES